MDGWMDRWGQWEGSWREAPPLFMTHNNAFSDELQSNFELPAHACSLRELPFNAFDSRVWFPLSYIALWIQMAQMNSDLHQTSQPHGALMFTLFFTSSRRLFTLWSYLVKEQGVHLSLVKSWVSLCKTRAFLSLLFCRSRKKTHQCRQYRLCKYLVGTRLSPVNICEQQIKLFAICMQCAAFFHSQWPFAGLSGLKDKIWQQRLLRNLICCPQSRNEANPIIDG